VVYGHSGGLALSRQEMRGCWLSGQSGRMSRTCLLLVLLLLTLAATCSSHPRVHDYGAVHTGIGAAHIYCGGKYTASCSGEAALVFPVCSKAYENFFGPLNRALTPTRLDDRVRRLVGKPPTGGRWADVRCGMPRG
jgi:hypothetical protein